MKPDAHGKWLAIFEVFNAGYTYTRMIEIRSEFHLMLLPFSKKDKANKCTCVHTRQTIPTLRRAPTSSIKLTKSLALF